MAETVLAQAKKRDTPNLTDKSGETINYTSDAACNPILSNVQIPDINRITYSLQKIDFIISTAHMLWPENTIAEQVIADTVEIVHGRGTGRLMKAIHEHLKDNQFVGQFTSGDVSKGGTGVTIVHLKE